MKKSEKRDLGQLKNVVFKVIGIEKIQILQFPSKFIEGSSNSFTSNTAFIWEWARNLEQGEALSLDKFLLYCRSNRDVFNVADIITINDFKSFSRYTLKSCSIGQGLYKLNGNGEKCFFCVYRQKSDGRIMGAWLPYNDETKEILKVTTMTKEDAEKKAEAKRKALYERLAKEFAK